MIKLNPNELESTLSAYCKMNAAQALIKINQPLPEALLENLSPSSNDHAYLEQLENNYKQQYKNIQKNLGYLSILTHQQFSLYLDVHLEKGKTLISDAFKENIARNIDATNYHFQIRAYWQIAKVSALALFLILGLTILAVTLPSVIYPTTSAYINIDLNPAFCLLGTVITGLSGFGLFHAAKKISPTAEEMITYQPTLA